MKLKEFNNRDDLERNFSNVYIEFGGRVCYSTLANAGVKLTLYPIGDDGKLGRGKNIDPNHAFANVPVLCPKLGWIMHRGSPHYLYRNTKRQYKFGAGSGTIGYYAYAFGAIVPSGNWPFFGEDVVKWFVQKPMQYNPKEYFSWMTHAYVSIDGELYKDTHRIGIRSAAGKFALDRNWDDSLTRLDLEKLGVPLHD